MSHRRAKKIKASQALPARPQVQEAPKGLHEPVGLSFKYVDPGGKYCLSHCNKDEVRHFKDCLRTLTTLTWQEVLGTGSKGEGKTGLAYTPYDDHAIVGATRPASLDRSLTISSVRASQGYRVFGTFKNFVYYVLWFDRTHAIVKSKH
jgi:hypothetical protein